MFIFHFDEGGKIRGTECWFEAKSFLPERGGEGMENSSRVLLFKYFSLLLFDSAYTTYVQSLFDIQFRM